MKRMNWYPIPIISAITLSVPTTIVQYKHFFHTAIPMCCNNLLFPLDRCKKVLNRTFLCLSLSMEFSKQTKGRREAQPTNPQCCQYFESSKMASTKPLVALVTGASKGIGRYGVHNHLH